jgi:hypothetical protein
MDQLTKGINCDNYSYHTKYLQEFAHRDPTSPTEDNGFQSVGGGRSRRVVRSFYLRWCYGP